MMTRKKSMMLFMPLLAMLLTFTSKVEGNQWGNYYADTYCPCQYFQSGPYIGATVGYDFLQLSERDDTIVPGLLHFKHEGEHTPRGAVGDFFGGYSFLCNCFYGAAEIFGTWSGTRERTHVDHTQGGIRFEAFETRKLRSSVGIRFLPGIVIHQNTLVFAMVGWERARFHIDTQAQFVDITPIVENKFRKSVNGITFGGGVQIAICQNLHLRGSYFRSIYKKQRIEEGVKYKFYDNRVAIGLVIPFGGCGLFR